MSIVARRYYLRESSPGSYQGFEQETLIRWRMGRLAPDERLTVLNKIHYNRSNVINRAFIGWLEQVRGILEELFLGRKKERRHIFLSHGAMSTLLIMMVIAVARFNEAVPKQEKVISFYNEQTLCICWLTDDTITPLGRVGKYTRMNE